MAGASDYLELKVLDHLLGGPDYSRPATVYLAMFTTAPTDAGGGTEVSATGYGRLAVTNNATNFPAALSGVKTLGTTQQFAEALADWGTVVAVGVFDAISGGNLLMWALLNAPVAVATGNSAKFSAGNLLFTLD